MTNNIDLLIIGSGISGLSAYLEAKKKKINNILIIDKGFHVGGRICSKNLNNIYFNHGAPFICRSKIKKSLSFFNLLKHNKNISRTVIKNICNKSQIVYYPSPMMRSFFDDFNNKVIIKQKTKAINVERDGNFFIVNCSDNKFIITKKIVLSVPAPQVSELIQKINPQIVNEINKIKYSKCLAFLIAFDQKVDIPKYSFFEDDAGDLSTLFCGITFSNYQTNSVVVRMSNKWSEINFEYDKETIIRKCLLLLSKKITHFKKYNISSTYCHKWRYSQVINWLSPSIPNVNKDKSIGFAGDWTVGPTIEDAFVSGEKVVKNLL